MAGIARLPLERRSEMTAGLSDALDRYVEVSPAKERGGVDLIRTSIQDLIEDLADDDYAVTSAEWKQRIQQIERGDRPYEEFRQAIDGLRPWVEANCRTSAEK